MSKKKLTVVVIGKECKKKHTHQKKNKLGVGCSIKEQNKTKCLDNVLNTMVGFFVI